MNAEATTEAVSNFVGESGSDTGAPVFVSLRQSAALEFHACIQLLAERARFLTGAAGAAVALSQDGQFVFCAATGNLVPEIGATADITKYPLREGIRTGQPVQLPGERHAIKASGEGLHPSLAVPLLRDERIVGVFELAPGAGAFADADVEAITRLSAMVSTALDHRDAAEHTESLIREAKSKQPAVTAGSILWHAPEPASSEPAASVESRAPAPADIHACTACGFPVSGRRTLCLDCDKHRDNPKNESKTVLNPPAEIFTFAKEESWIDAHGYTIASLLVTALAAAIIFWLR